MGLFPHNCYDTDIVNQPETEYRKAKYPFRVRHCYKDAKTEKSKYWDSTHCPVCFWDINLGIWDSLIDKNTRFCRRCGQKINWDDET